MPKQAAAKRACESSQPEEAYPHACGPMAPPQTTPWHHHEPPHGTTPHACGQAPGVRTREQPVGGVGLEVSVKQLLHLAVVPVRPEVEEVDLRGGKKKQMFEKVPPTVK